MGLVVEPGTPHVHGRGVLDHPLLGRVAVETGDGGQTPSDRRPGPAAGLEVAGIELDVGAVDVEQAQAVLAAPGQELAQVERVGLLGSAAIAGQEAGESDCLDVDVARVIQDERR